MSVDTTIQTAAPPAATAAGGKTAASAAEGHGSFSFHDILDALNPLQHLPIVSTIYRAVTGDTISNAARIAGDTLYGGPVGLLIGLADADSVDRTGKDLGQRAVAAITGEDDAPPSPPTGSAGAGSPPPAQVAAGTAPAPATPASAGPPTRLTQAQALALLPKSGPVDLAAFPALPQAQEGSTDALPRLGAASTANALHAAAPVTPQLVAATGLARAPTTGSAPQERPGGIPLVQQRGIAIDTSETGIAALRARSTGTRMVPLQLSGGLHVAATGGADTAPAADAVGAQAGDFAVRMKQGLDKYNALLAARNQAAGSAGEKPAASGDGAASADSVN